MPQIQLPLFPEGAEHITPELAVTKRDGRVVYFNGQMPVFMHDESDIQTFRMITSQFVVNGNATQAQIAATFGIPIGTVKRYVKLYREKGARGFFAARNVRGASVLTMEMLAKVQGLLDEGQAVTEIARQLGLLADTLRKAVKDGRLHQVKKTPLTPADH
jgi:transposase-like protein